MDQTLSNSMLLQNEFTDVLFWLTIIVEVWAFYKVFTKVHDPLLFGILFVIIISNIGDSAVYFIDGTLYNISLLRTAITMGLLCYVLVKINMTREKKLQTELENERLKNAIIIEQIYLSFSGTKKKLCKSHYDRIVNQDLEGACSDCPVVEQLNLNK